MGDTETPQPRLLDDESSRLAELYESGLLDTPRERPFDRLTRLAQALFGAEVALVGLVDQDREWFKAAIGLGLRETPREWSFCDHVLREAGVLWVEDLSKDPRFVGTPLVVGEPKARFFCGAPIRLESGRVMGGMCVMGRAPRAFDAGLAERLEDLAEGAAQEIDRRIGERRSAAAHRQAQRSERRLRFALDMGDLLAFETSSKAGETYFEGRLDILASTGLPADAYKADPLLLADPAGHGGPLDQWRRTATVGETFRHIYQVPGSQTWMSARADIVSDGEDGTCVVGIVKDISRFRRHEQMMDEAREAAESSNRLKSEFLANMSHELRTPLNGVLAVAGVLADTPLQPTQREMMDIVVHSAEHLQRLLSDILDLSRIDSGRMEFSARSFQITPFMREIAALFEPAAQRKDLALNLVISPEADAAVVADDFRLRQILTNLLSNAIKFTEQGSVTVDVDAAPSPQGFGLRFQVRDSGIGFEPAFKERLFERFIQADGSITRKFGGTGLGLAICRALAHGMGGALDAESIPGAGAAFTLELPVELGAEEVSQVEVASAAPIVDAAARPLRVLLAEDHEINRRVVELILNPLGIDLTCVENGEEAVRAFEAGRFDLILMDLQMPVMGGLEAIRSIRAREAAGSRTPIYALTANALGEHREACFAAGADDHLTKPFTPDALLSAVARVSVAGDQARTAAVA